MNNKQPSAGGGGGGALLSPPFFQKAIFSAFSDYFPEASLWERKTFAKQYADARPHLRSRFDGQSPGGNNHIDQAVAAFRVHLQQSHQAQAPCPPRQPSPQPSPQLAQPHNSDNLFGRLMAVAKCWRVLKELTINYLKWYTSQPHISPIAQNPSHQDFISAVEEMRRAISPAATMFAIIRESGLSQETVGTNVFGELMRMSNGPVGSQIWAFDACPDPDLLQYAITLKKVGPFDHVTGFIKGVFFDQTGKATHFNWPNFKSVTAAPKSMIGSHALVWASEVGEAVYTKTMRDFGGVSLEAQTELADKNSYGGACAYVGGGRDDYCSLDMAVAARLDSIRSEDRDEFFERPHVTADTKQDLSKENEQLIRSNPMYIQLVNEAMVRIGGTLLPSSLSSAATAATEVLAPSAPIAEHDTIFCQHLKVVRRSSGECTPCATCLAGPPGRGKIFDDWGQTVIGYKYKS